MTCTIQAFTLAETLATWKKHKLELYPDDVLNMMIDHGLINKTEAEEAVNNVKKKTTFPTLPNTHIGVK